jgi:hypothetical protein
VVGHDEGSLTVAPPTAPPASVAKSTLRRQIPEVEAVCGKAARTALCGGRIAICVPTAILISPLSPLVPLSPLNRVLALVVREGTVLAAIGLGLGLIGAYFVGRAMQSLLFGVRALDFSAFSAVALILLASAPLACYLPARRAASVEPMRVLRTE